MPEHSTRNGSRKRHRTSNSPKIESVDTQHRNPSNHKLPYDILREVFQQVCATLPELGDQLVVPPTRLGAICAYWRYVAWSTPRLWTFLRLTKSFWLSKNRINVLNLYLTNIGLLTLDLIIVDCPRNPAGEESFNNLLGVHPVIPAFELPAQDVFTTIFVQHSDKLKSLVMSRYMRTWLYEIAAISKSHSFVNLEAFIIRDRLSFANFGISTRLDPTFVIHNAPLLNTLSLNGLQCAFVFPWTQITSLCLCAVNARRAMQAILQCVNLEDLEITDLEEMEDESVVFPEDTTNLPRLRSFTFSDFAVVGSWRFGLAFHLAFPALTYLVLCVSLSQFPHHKFFLSNLPATLTHLEICCNHTKYCTELLLEYLPRWKSLHSLTFMVDGKIPIDVINRLVVGRQEGSVVLPALTRFSLAISTPASWIVREEFSTILELVRSRRRRSRPEGVARILSLSMILHSPWLDLNNWPKSFKFGVEELVQDGLDVSIVVSGHLVLTPWLERSEVD